MVTTGLRGYTLGKYLLGARVVNLNGGKVGVLRALLREILLAVGIFALLVSIWLPLVRKDRRSFHDLMTNTAVITIL